MNRSARWHSMPGCSKKNRNQLSRVPAVAVGLAAAAKLASAFLASTIPQFQGSMGTPNARSDWSTKAYGTLQARLQQ